MSFQKLVREHLCSYKHDQYPCIPSVDWRGKKYFHIFPDEYKYYNIMEIYRQSFISSKYNSIKLSKDFSHLTSSQALGINLLYPLIINKELELLLEILGLSNEEVVYDSVVFDKKGIERFFSDLNFSTKFDFYLETKSNKKIYFKIKYYENNLGYSKISKTHQNRYNQIYSKLLHPFIEKYQNQDVFFKHYKIMKQLVHINNGTYLIYICPRANKTLSNQLNFVHESVIKDDYKDFFITANIENIINFFRAKITNIEMLRHYDSFMEKYLNL